MAFVPLIPHSHKPRVLTTTWASRAELDEQARELVRLFPSLAEKGPQN